MGWIFVCFDLPTVEKSDMREANRFRKNLLNLGYFMLQESIYVRNCVSYEKTEKYIANIERIAPPSGAISVFFITDKQWSSSVNIQFTGYAKSKYKIKPAENAPKQMTFW